MIAARLIALAALAVLLSHSAAAQRAGSRADAEGLYQVMPSSEDIAPRRWWELGHALFDAGRHREAIAAFERALQLGAGDPADGSWQIARAYAHRGNRKQALRWLSRAAELGLDARAAIRGEPLFEQYRGDPRFSAITDPSPPPRRYRFVQSTMEPQ